MDTIWPPDFTKTTGPKYSVLIQSIREAIRDQVFQPGDKLPPVRELAWDLGITPGTVARAYRIGISEGLLAGETGRGTFVATTETAPEPLEPLYAETAGDAIDLRPVRLAEVGQREILRDALRGLADDLGDAVSYPTRGPSRGVRAAVAGWIGRDLIGAFDADDVILTLGAQHATGLAFKTILTGPAPVILTEALTYPGFRRTAQGLRAKLVGVEMDQHGIRPDRLAEAYRLHGAQALVICANVHNPTGLCMPLARRQEIADMARSVQLQIIEDDCQRIGETDLPSFRALVPELAWYVSSLSKTFSAAIRFGYMVPSRRFSGQAQQVVASSFYGMPHLLIDLIEPALRDGRVDRIRQRLVAMAGERVRDAVNILGAWDIAWREDVPFLWLRLPRGWRGSDFAIACAQEGIELRPADTFAPGEGPVENGVRITLNLELPPDRISHALRRIDAILQRPPETMPV